MTDACPEPVEGPTIQDLIRASFETRTPTQRYAWWMSLSHEQRRTLSAHLRLQGQHDGRRIYP